MKTGKTRFYGETSLYMLIHTCLTLIFSWCRSDFEGSNKGRFAQVLFVCELKHSVTSFSPQDVPVKAPRPQHSSGPRSG